MGSGSGAARSCADGADTLRRFETTMQAIEESTRPQALTQTLTLTLTLALALTLPLTLALALALALALSRPSRTRPGGVARARARPACHPSAWARSPGRARRGGASR